MMAVACRCRGICDVKPEAITESRFFGLCPNIISHHVKPSALRSAQQKQAKSHNQHASPYPHQHDVLFTFTKSDSAGRLRLVLLLSLFQ